MTQRARCEQALSLITDPAHGQGRAIQTARRTSGGLGGVAVRAGEAERRTSLLSRVSPATLPPAARNGPRPPLSLRRLRRWAHLGGHLRRKRRDVAWLPRLQVEVLEQLPAGAVGLLHGLDEARAHQPASPRSWVKNAGKSSVTGHWPSIKSTGSSSAKKTRPVNKSAATMLA